MTDDRSTPGGSGRDQSMELALGRLLQAGVLIAALIVAAGGALLFIAHRTWVPEFHLFHGTRLALRSVAGIFAGALALRPDAVIQAGLLVLIATPVLRVALSLYEFARKRDLLYVFLTLVVLCILAAGLAGWNP